MRSTRRLLIVGWRKGQGERLEYWIKPKTWQGIFDHDESAALTAGQMLKEACLFRVQDRDRCQAVLERHPMKSARAYVVKAKILEWRPQADNALRQLRKQQLQPPVLPDNFASLPPEAKQNFLLSNAML